MRNQHYGIAFIMDLGKNIHDFIRGFAIQVTGGFIGKNNGGIVDQCPGNGNPLALPTGKLIGFVVAPVRQVHLAQNFMGHFHSGFFVDACINQRKGYILQCAQSGKKVELLKHESNFLVPDVCQAVVQHGTHIMAIQNVFA